MNLVPVTWAALIAAAVLGCGPSAVVWSGTCRATCDDGRDVTFSESVCTSPNSDANTEAQNAVDACLASIDAEDPTCGNPTCACTVARSTTEC